MSKHIHYYGQKSLDPQYMVCACGVVKPRSEVTFHDLCVWCFAKPKRPGRHTCSEECAEELQAWERGERRTWVYAADL